MTMKTFAFLFWILTVYHLEAQYVTTYYFNSDFTRLTTQNNYKYKATVVSENKNLSGFVKVRVELNDGTLLQKYAYSDLEKGLRRDTILIFNEDGSMYSYAPYNLKGEPESEFIFYENGKLLSEKYFKNGQLNGISKSYFKNGTLKKMESFEDGVNSDTTYYFFESGPVKEKFIYEKGSKKYTLSYNTSGAIQFQYIFNTSGDTTEVIDLRNEMIAENDSIPDKYEIIEELPFYAGGVSALYKYLATNIEYPREARDSGIMGSVRVKFTVDKTGDVINLRIINPVYPLLDFEAMRVIQDMPDWTPGKQNGENVDVWYTLPVKFSMQ